MCTIFVTQRQGSRNVRCRSAFAVSGCGAKERLVATASLRQRSIVDDASHIPLRLPLGDLAALHPDGCFALVEDPRSTNRALLVGMMVLRPGSARWKPDFGRTQFSEAVQQVTDWSYDVRGIGGSWPVSGGNALDAFRLALQYGCFDAVIAGAATLLREGVAGEGRRAHLWQPWVPLSWPALRDRREELEAAITKLRRDWQELGVVSSRRWPAQIVASRSGRGRDGAELFDAEIFRARHPDGSAVEALLLTSETGAGHLRERARARGVDVEASLLVASPPGLHHEIDLARLPELLRSRLDARLVEHDGGAVSLEAFLAGGAMRQLNLTLMRERSVRDIVAASPRIDDAQRRMLLESWEGRARCFPQSGSLPREWRPVYAIAEEDGEAVAVTFAVT